MRQIVADGNHYLIAVKGNQSNLFEHLQEQFNQNPPDTVEQSSECTRDRVVERTVKVLAAGNEAILKPWVGVQRLVCLERRGTRGKQPFEETMFYISSLPLDAVGFAALIRQHWHIENRLHWVKDVVLKEDTAPLCDGHAPVNFAIVRTIAMNLLRHHGFASITKGIRKVKHDIPRLFSFFQ